MNLPNRAMITFASALALVGCMKPNPLAELANHADRGDGDGDPGDGDTGDGDTGDGDPGDGDPGDGDPGDGDPSPLPDLGAEQSCAPLDAYDPVCATCLADGCCLVATSCAEAEACECLAACQLSGGTPGNCKNLCGPKPQDVPELAPLLACIDASCSDAC